MLLGLLQNHYCVWQHIDTAYILDAWPSSRNPDNYNQLSDLMDMQVIEYNNLLLQECD